MANHFRRFRKNTAKQSEAKQSNGQEHIQAKQREAKQRNAKQCSGHEHCKPGAKQSEAKLGSRRSTHSGVPKYYMHGRTARVASFLFVVTYKRIEYATNPETQVFFFLYCRQAFAELSQTRPPRPLRRARVLIYNAMLIISPFLHCLCSAHTPSYHHVHAQCNDASFGSGFLGGCEVGARNSWNSWKWMQCKHVRFRSRRLREHYPIATVHLGGIFR